ncbi:MAG: chromophore lyase CpcT/CpeT [Thainema sp.]
MTEPLWTLAQWLAGEFSNQSQALDQPAWFVHLRLWHRPLPQRFANHMALFAEQANVLHLDQPYRQRLMLLKPDTDPQILQVQYLAFRDPSQFRGAGTNPERLAAITSDDVEHLSGCVLTVRQNNGTFEATMPPEARCCFQYAGQTRQVELGFTATPQEFYSRDRGIDPETGQGLWGAMMGAYQFQRQQDWSGELPRG